MTGELDILGVFISPLLAWGLIALALHSVLRAGLDRVGFNRAVWHAPLADLALLVIMFGIVTRLGTEWMGS
jgi:hypothetical protein